MALPHPGLPLLHQELKKRQVIHRCTVTTANRRLPEPLHQRRRPLSEQLRVQVVYPRQKRPHHARVPRNQPSRPGRQRREFQARQQLVVLHVRLRQQPERGAEEHERLRNQRRLLPLEALRRQQLKQLKQRRNRMIKE